MDWPRLLLHLAQAAGVVFLAASWMGRNPWFLLSARKIGAWIGSRSPARAIRRDLDPLAAHIALLRLEVSLLEQVTAAPLVATDRKGTLTWASNPFCELVGMTREQLNGDGWRNAVHQLDREDLFRAWRGAVVAGSEFTWEYRYHRARTGEDIWVRAEVFPAHHPLTGKVVGWVGLIRPLSVAPAWSECPKGHFIPPLR